MTDQKKCIITIQCLNERSASKTLLLMTLVAKQDFMNCDIFKGKIFTFVL